VDISVIIPAYDEEKTIQETIDGICKILNREKSEFEIIVVDDNSKDSTNDIVTQLQKKYANLILLKNVVNKGKSFSLNCGFQHAKGSIIIMMDADLQQIPDDIPLLLNPIKKNGIDFVNGWRKQRNDPLSKRIISKIYNSLSRFVFKTTLHDMNCGFKAMKKEVLNETILKPDYFRYLPALAHSAGFKVIEVPVQHFSRKHGESKYGFNRVLGVVDLFSIKLKLIFSQKPMLFFGSISSILLIIGLVGGIYLAILKLLLNQPIGEHIPLLFLSTISIITGVMLVSMGFLADLIKDLEHRLDEKRE